MQATSTEASPSAVAQNDGLIFGLGSEGAWDEAVVGSPVVRRPSLQWCTCSRYICPQQTTNFRLCWNAEPLEALGRDI